MTTNHKWHSRRLAFGVVAPNPRLVAGALSNPIIGFLNHSSEEVKLAIIKEDGWKIQFIENPSEAVQIAAVQQDGDALQYIENPSEDVKIAAIKQNPHVIEFVNNPPEELQLIAVDCNKQFTLMWINNVTMPTLTVVESYVKIHGRHDIIGLDETLTDPEEIYNLLKIQSILKS